MSAQWGTWGRVPTELLMDRDLSSHAIRLYAVMDDRANRDSQACWPSIETLSEQCGSSRSTVKRALEDLITRGWVTRAERYNGGRQTSNLYTILREPTEIRGSTCEPPPQVTCEPPPQVTCEPQNQNHDEPEPDEPAPPGPLTGEADGQLFAGAAKERTPRSEVAHASDKLDAVSVEAFVAWWDRYPKGKGSKAKAQTAWRKAIRRGSTSITLERWLDNYLEALKLYHSVWDVWPSVLHGSTFLNSRGKDFDESWDRQQIEFWPAPNGKSWENVPSSGSADHWSAEAMDAERDKHRARLDARAELIAEMDAEMEAEGY